MTLRSLRSLREGGKSYTTDMKRIVLVLLVATAAFAQSSSIEKDVRTLAADDMEGRGLGTKGIDKAAAYLEGRMHAIWLEPVFGRSFRQPLLVKFGVSADAYNRLGELAVSECTLNVYNSHGPYDVDIAH